MTRERPRESRRVADHLRNRFSQDNLIDGYARTAAVEEDGEDGWDWMLATEQRQLLGAALKRLPQEERQIVILKYTENWTYQQLSENVRSVSS